MFQKNCGNIEKGSFRNQGMRSIEKEETVIPVTKKELPKNKSEKRIVRHCEIEKIGYCPGVGVILFYKI